MPRALRTRAPPPPPQQEEEEEGCSDSSGLSEPEDIESGQEALDDVDSQAGDEEEEEVEEGDGHDDEGVEGEAEIVQLKFNQDLTWPAGRAPATKVLLRRLEELYDELHALDQEVLDLASISKVREGLAHRNMLTHKDAGIKAYAACCIVELLRVTAPDAPFERHQLQAIFTMIIKQIIPLLHNTADPYHAQHAAILSSLAEVKSIVLLTDVEGSDQLIYDLFVKLFDTGNEMRATSEDPALRDIQARMVDIMAILVDESEGDIPAKVIDAVMAQFLRAVPSGGRPSAGRDVSQTTLLPKTEPVPYTMAKALCNECYDRMSRYFGQYFNDFVLDASKFGSGSKAGAGGGGGGGADGDDHRVGRAPTDDELRELRRAHDLIRELWRAAPDVLVNVVPQVEVELSMDNPDMRRIATETIGDMISGIGARGPPLMPVINPAAYPPPMLTDEAAGSFEVEDVLTKPISPSSFVQKYPVTYKIFLGRRNDKSAGTRASWVSAVGYILSTSAGGIGLSRDEKSELVKELGEKLNDQDEKVRLAATKAIETMSVRDVVYDLGRFGGMQTPGSVLADFSDRCRDRRPAVRVEATILMAKLWAAATGELAAGNEAVTTCLADIPSRILNAFYANNLEINLLIDRVLYEYLLPLNFPVQKKLADKGGSQSSAISIDATRVRTERMLLLLKHLDKPAKKAFFILAMRQPKYAQGIEKFIQTCEAFNNGAAAKSDKDLAAKQLNKIIDWLASLFPDQSRTKSDLNKFVKLNDRRCYQLVKFAISPDSDYTTVSRSFKELIKRVGANNAAAPALETLVPLFYRFAFLVLNKVHIGALIECSTAAGGGWMTEAAQEFLNEVSQSEPALISGYSVRLQNDIADNAPSESKANDASVAATLKAFSAFARSQPGGISIDRQFAQKIMAYALYGRPTSTAKHAVTILMSSQDDQKLPYAVSLMNKIMKGFAVDSAHFLNKLAAISQIELLAPTVTADYEAKIRDVAVQKLILQTRAGRKDTDPDWVQDSDMDDELVAKCLALRLLANRFRAAATEDTADQSTVKARGHAVLKMLSTIIQQKGEVATAKNTPNHYRSRLLFEAALLSLKLCKIPLVDEMYTGVEFNNLALVAQDRIPQVRHAFVEKLLEYLGHRRLRPRFHTIAFLTAFEPSTQFKSRIETWLRSMARGSDHEPKQPMTSIVARLISLLAHHPDYSPDDGLVDTGRYLVYYVNLVATEANLGRIQAYAEKAKQANDGIDPAMTERIRLLCDMTRVILQKWQQKKGWTFLACPEKVGLPIGLFTPLRSHDEAQTVAETNYLPAGVEEQLEVLIRSFDKKSRDLKRKSLGGEGEGEPPSKKSKAGSRAGAAKRRLPSRPKAKAKARRVQREDSEADWGERRRSGRSTKSKPVYVETDSEENENDDIDENEEEEEEEEQDEEQEEEEENGEEVEAANGDGESEADVQMEDSESSSLSDLEDTEDAGKKSVRNGKTRAKKAEDEPAASVAAPSKAGKRAVRDHRAAQPAETTTTVRSTRSRRG